MDAQAKTVTLLTATCHCAGAKLSFAVPITALPLRALACHCTNCRQSTGVLPYVTASLPGSEQPEQDLEEEERNGTLKHYRSSSLLVRWFCSRCGTHIVRVAQYYLIIFVMTLALGRLSHSGMILEVLVGQYAQVLYPHTLSFLRAVMDELPVYLHTFM
jgi:hypothetical protein